MSPPHDFGAVAVIDGTEVKVTPFRTANIPPPMSMFQLVTEGNVIDVAFGHEDAAIAILHTHGVDLYSWATKNGRRVAPVLAAKSPVPLVGEGQANEVALQIFCSGPGEFSVVSYVLGNEVMLRACVLEGPETVRWTPAETPLPGSISMLCNSSSFFRETETKGSLHSRSGDIVEITGGEVSSE